MERLRPYFPKNHGVPRVDDRRVQIGIIFINRKGLRWRDAPREYGPHKTLYNRWKRWSDMGVFARIMTGLAAKPPDHKTISISDRSQPSLHKRPFLRIGIIGTAQRSEKGVGELVKFLSGAENM